MSRLCTVNASTSRNISQSGKAPVSTQIETGLLVMPLSVLDPKTQSALKLDTPHQLKQTCFQSTTRKDIKNGDFLVISGTNYPIISVGDSPWMGGYRYQLIVEILGN
jgi:hypothetical protein